MKARTDFEKMMLPILEASEDEEASHLVLDSWDHRQLEDAVLDAIESLPARKTVRLRLWVGRFDDYLRWLQLEKRGFRVEKLWSSELPTKHDQFILWIPSRGMETYLEFGESDGVGPLVGAAVGALAVHWHWRGEDVENSPRGERGVRFLVDRGAF